jgi:hypothetical protein
VNLPHAHRSPPPHSPPPSSSRSPSPPSLLGRLSLGSSSGNLVPVTHNSSHPLQLFSPSQIFQLSMDNSLPVCSNL